MATGEMAIRPADALVAGATGERGLVEQCRLGDPQAFGRLVSLHEGMVFSLAARLLGDREDAKDVAQEVFLQVYRTLDRFEGRSSLRTWIYRIVVNQCWNRQRWWRRRRKDRACGLDELTAADQAHVTAPEGTHPFEELRRRERAQRVQTALLGLSFDHRAILILREVEGLSGDEIAGALGLPGGTVKSRLARAREALRVLLLPVIPEEERS